ARIEEKRRPPPSSPHTSKKAILFIDERLKTESFDYARENLNASFQLCDRHELAGAMRRRNIAGAEHAGLCAQLHHLRRFRAEGDRARRLAGRGFEMCDERRAGFSLHAAVEAYDINPAVEA